MEARFPPAPRSYGPEHQAKMSAATENDGGEQMRAADCNLSSLCEHVQVEGFNAGAFSDVVVQAMGSTYHLHRLILSRSPYFRNMLHGPWKEAGSPVLTLLIDDKNVNTEAIAMALAYLYGHHPKLNDDNAFRILAAASFLDLQDLCRICTDYIISELWTSNFLAYQVFAESQDYGRHGERVRHACWGYLCQSGATELKEVLPKLSSQTLFALLTSDELWVPSEEKRFELALYTLLAKGSLSRAEVTEESSSTSEVGVPDSKEEQMHQVLFPVSALETVRARSVEQSSSSGTSFSEMNETKSTCAYVEVATDGTTSSLEVNRIMAMEGPSEGGSFHLNMNTWLASDLSSPGTSVDPLNDRVVNDWGRCGMPSLSWGGRTVGRRQVKGNAKGNCGIHRDYYDTFINIFEGGSLLYCNMSFEELLNARKQLEELGFPGKAVNDGLWLQMLLSQRVLEIGADTCNACCFISMECTCRQPFGYSQGTNYYVQENEHYNSPGSSGNVYVGDAAAQGQRNELFRPVRVHVRGQVDGLAGIGRGTSFVPASAWPPTRFVFSRVPFGMGNRTGQQSVGNDDSENRTEHGGDLTGDGLTALVGLSQGGNNNTNIHAEQVEGVYEADSQGKLSGASFAMPTSSGITVQMAESQDCAVGIEWEGTDSSLISLDMKTPLSHFPPFRFGVEFAEVHRLGDGQVKHSPEFFYAGSLWKVSVQAFNDEDPQGRRTLGLFLHRRKAEPTDSIRKVHMFVDSREKVKARYQLICPSKREVMVFGSFKQRGTLLPKAPKGWGWRSALLFDELPELLQCGTLRIAAIVQLV